MELTTNKKEINKGVIVGLKYKKLTGKGANNNEAFDSGFAIRTKVAKVSLEKQEA